jgi:hypothetical protein
MFQIVDVNEAVRRAMEQHPKQDIPRSLSPLYRHSPLSIEQVAIHNDDLDKYYAQCADYYKRLNRWVQARGRFYDFDLYLGNRGKAIASTILVELIFPSFVRLLTPEVKLASSDPLPRPPRVPPRPDPLRGLQSVPLPLLRGRPLVEQFADEPYRPRVTFQGENGSRLCCTLGKLLHGVAPTCLGEFTYWFPEGRAPTNFGASCSIRAAELPKEDASHVVFKVCAGA